MTFRGKMEISRRTAWMVTLFLGIIVLLATLSLAKLRYIGSELKEILGATISVTGKVTGVRGDRLKMAIWFEKGMRRAEKANMAGFTDAAGRFDTLARRAGEKVTTAEKISAEARNGAPSEIARDKFNDMGKALKQIKHGLVNYHLQGKEAFQMVRDGKFKEAESLGGMLENKGAALAYELREALRNLEMFSQESASKAESNDIAAERFLWFIGILALVMGCGLGILVVQSFRPNRQVTDEPIDNIAAAGQ